MPSGYSTAVQVPEQDIPKAIQYLPRSCAERAPKTPLLHQATIGLKQTQATQQSTSTVT